MVVAFTAAQIPNIANRKYPESFRYGKIEMYNRTSLIVQHLYF